MCDHRTDDAHPRHAADAGIAAGRNYSGPWRATPGRYLGLGLVRLYQLTLSPLIGSHCRHLPTCSEYAYEAVARHGLWSGGWLSVFRVCRCGPFGTSGIDNVPEALPPQYRWWAPWRLLRLGRPAERTPH
tara:strand:+ start:333 stop:722 length:390 start_codon:yes stop_codon:yes gene_type:complete